MIRMHKLMILACTMATFAASCQVATAQKTLSTVVIDAGHGGKDPGALGKKCKEKDLVLDVALRVGKMISDSIPEVKTIYTRDTDVFIPLDKRAEIANKNDADLFISIHANWIKNPAITGAETFVLGLHRSKENLEVAQKENSVIVLEDDYTNKYEGFDPSEPESYIIFELMQNIHLEQSIVMASLIQNEFGNAKRSNRGVKQAGFLVLRQTSMPSVLVELGFLSNPTEEAYMMSEEGKQELAYSVYKAFRTYKRTYDGGNKITVNQPVEEPKPVDDKGIYFRIQIASAKKPIEIKETKYGSIYSFQEDGTYKYAVGDARNYDDASKLLKKVRKDYPDCFVIALEDGKKISVRAARKKTDK